MTCDKEKIRAALMDLGSNPDEVAAKLIDRGITGQSEPNDCPLYHFLDREFPELEHDIYVTGDYITATGYVFIDEVSPPSEVEMKRLADKEMAGGLPSSVWGFVEEFDGGKYPDLEMDEEDEDDFDDDLDDEDLDDDFFDDDEDDEDEDDDEDHHDDGNPGDSDDTTSVRST